MKVKDAGFHRIWATSFITLLLPALVASRCRRRRYTDSFDSEAEYRISAQLNQFLTKVLSIERHFDPTGCFLTRRAALFY